MDNEEEEEPVLFTGVRRVLQGLIGHTLIDVTGADEEDPAARAYDKVAKEVHGVFAKLNFPEKVGT